MKLLKRIILILVVLILAASLLAAFVPLGPDLPTEASQTGEENFQACQPLKQAVSASPQTLTVKPGDTIQAAVNRAQAGDTIVVLPGTYNEDVVIRLNNLTLRGQMDGDRRPLLDGENGLFNGVIACGDQFTVENLELRNYVTNGVYVRGVDGVTFRNLFTAHTGEYGLYPVHSKNILMEKNTASGADDTGLYIGQSTDVIVRGNEAYGNVSGIEIENTDNSTVINNFSHDNTAGLLVFASPQLARKETNNTQVFKNRLINNNVKNFGPAGSLVSNLPSGLGILIMNADHTTVAQNEIRDNKTSAIVMVSLRTFVPDRQAFDVGTEPEGNSISDNTIVHNAYDPDPVAKKYGYPAVDLLWDGSGWGNVWNQPGLKTFPPWLPSPGWPLPLNNLYVRVLGIARKFL